MKKLFSLTFMIVAITAAANAQSTADNAGLQARMSENMVAGARIGSLVCENANGKMALCSGDEFERVLGFATSTPYVTINKRPKGENQDTFEGFASMAGGEISAGDYICAGPNGTVKRCDNAAFAYGKAQSSASSEGQTVTVRIFGHKR